MNYVYLNNQILEERKAYIPVKDRGFLYGDGIFTTIRVENGYPKFLETHLNKFYAQSNQLSITPPKIETKSIYQLIEVNDALEGIYRLKIFITRENSSPPLALTASPINTLLMTLESYSPPKNPYQVNILQQPISGLLHSYKTLSFLERLWIKQQAIKQNVDDLITINSEGYLLETAFANIFWIIDNTLFTPDPSLPLYYGATLEIITKNLKSNYKLEFTKTKWQEIPKQAPIYLTNSLLEIHPIKKIEDTFFPFNTLTIEDLIHF